MTPLRVKMIVVACILIEYVLEEYKLQTLVCTNYALKEGVVHRVMENRL